MKMCEGFDHGHPEWTLTGREDIKQCIRLWPHKIKGEGHFLALLKKEDGPQPTFKYEKIKKVKLTPETEEFFKNCKMDIDWSHVREHQGKLFYLKEDIPEMKKVRVLRKGLYLGEMKKGRFEPSQSFAVALSADEYKPYLSFDINDENTIKYLKCETLDVDTATEGIHLIGTNEFPLGWAKIKKGRLKNKIFFQLEMVIMAKKTRLDKFLCDSLNITRKEAKEAIKKGKVTINGEIVKKPESKLDAEDDQVELEHQPVIFEQFHYLMLHKPQGVVSATKDDHDKTVLDLIHENLKISCFQLADSIRIPKDY